MAHNTTYHQSLKCSPTETSTVEFPTTQYILNLQNHFQSRNLPVEIQKLLIPVNEKYRQTQSNILEPYYDRKTQAAPLKVNDFTFLLNPTLSNQP